MAKTARRRFFPTAKLECEFRAVCWSPSVLPTLGSVLACVSVDGRDVRFFDPVDSRLTTILPPLLSPHHPSNRITAMAWEEQETLLFGTHGGQRIALNVCTGATTQQSLSTAPILCVSGNAAVDARGRLFVNGVLRLDDGIMQPSFLAATSPLVMCKLRTVYWVEDDGHDVNTQQLALETGVIVAASRLHDGLLVATDTGGLYTVNRNGSWPFLPTTSSVPSFADESHVTEDETEEDATEGVERTLAVATHGNMLALVKTTESARQARIELHQIDTALAAPELQEPLNTERSTYQQPADQKLVSCPLCGDDKKQSLSVLADSCMSHHPITICSTTQTRIDTPSCFRCRVCKRAFSIRPPSCTFCHGPIRLVE